MCLYFLGYDCITNRCVGPPNHFHDFWCQWFSISRSWWYPCKLYPCLLTSSIGKFCYMYWLARHVLIFICIFLLIAQTAILWQPSCWFNGFSIRVYFAMLCGQTPFLCSCKKKKQKNPSFCVCYKLSVVKFCLCLIPLGSCSFNSRLGNIILFNIFFVVCILYFWLYLFKDSFYHCLIVFVYPM